MSDRRAKSIRIQEVVRDAQTSENRQIIEGQVRATKSHGPAKEAPLPPPPPKKR